MIVATLGRVDRLRAMVAGVLRCDPPPQEVLIVDGDAEGAAASLTELSTGSTRVVHLPSEPGLTRQRMVGLAAATTDVVLFLDDDVDIPTDTFAVLLSTYEDPTIVGATGRVFEPGRGRVGKTSRWRRLLPGGGSEGSFTRFGYPRRVLGDDETDIRFMQGCFMSARLTAALQTGFDTALPGYGLAEDEDFSYRLSRLGPIRYLPSLHIVHDNRGFGSRDKRSFDRTVVVNRTYLFRKNFERTPLARLQFGMFIGMLFVHRLLNLEWQGVLGLLDGIRDVRKGRMP